MAYYENNTDKLKLVPISDENEANGKGAVAPSQETVTNGTYAPLSRPLFIYVNKKSAARPEVKSFIEFYMKNAPALAKEIGSVPLTSELYTLVQNKFNSQVVGSNFTNGKTTIGVNLLEVLKVSESK